MTVKANRLKMELRTKRTFVLHLFGVKFEIVWNQFCYVYIYIYFYYAWSSGYCSWRLWRFSRPRKFDCGIFSGAYKKSFSKMNLDFHHEIGRK